MHIYWLSAITQRDLLVNMLRYETDGRISKTATAKREHAND
jgi:hypothetical protein